MTQAAYEAWQRDHGDAGCLRIFNTTAYVHSNLPGLAIITLGEEGRPDPFVDALPALRIVEGKLGSWNLSLHSDLHTGRLEHVLDGVRDVLLNAVTLEPDSYSIGNLVNMDSVGKLRFPVTNSPIAGKTLVELFATAGTGSAFLAAFPHPDAGQILTFFVVVGGTKIVFAAADGVGYALKHGLAYVLLKWMGAPADLLIKEAGKVETIRRRTRSQNATSASGDTEQVRAKPPVTDTDHAKTEEARSNDELADAEKAKRKRTPPNPA